MAIVWMDNFRMYGSDETKMTDGTPWVYISNSSSIQDDPDPTAEAGSKSLRFGSLSSLTSQAVRLAVPTVGDVFGVALRFWLDSLPGSTGECPSICFNNSSNQVLYRLTLRPNGSFYWYNDVENTTIFDTVSPLIFAGSWNHLEIKVNTTTGAVAVWKENAVVASLTGTDGGTPPGQDIAIIAFPNSLSQPGDGDPQMKDLVIYDDTGSNAFTNGTNPIGAVQVLNLMPDGDSSLNWTPSTGSTGYDLIDETASVSDADYISADDTPPAAAVFTLENLPEDIVTVRGLMTLVRAQKSDSGDAQLQISLTSNGSDDAGTDRPISTAFTYYWDVSETDPDTASTWTPGAVDAATVKVDRTV